MSTMGGKSGKQFVSQVRNFSSQYGSSWLASNICGAPKTYPQYGDIPTAWAPSTHCSGAEFLEFQFDTFSRVTQVNIYETYTCGRTVQISLYDYVGQKWEPIWSGPVQTNLPAAARIFAPALTRTDLCSNRIRLDIDTTSAPSYYEIDAIEIVGDAVPTPPEAKEKIVVSNITIPDDVPVAQQWVAKVNKFSSEYNGWPATNVCGPSNTYPNYGDLRTAWASATANAGLEFLELEYKDYMFVMGIDIYETYHPGAVVKIMFKDMKGKWITVYDAPAHQHTLPKQSRIFSPPLSCSMVTKEVRIEMNTSNSESWSELDAIKLVGILCGEEHSGGNQAFYRQLLVAANPNVYQESVKITESGCDAVWNSSVGSINVHSWIIQQRCPALYASLQYTSDTVSFETLLMFVEYLYTDSIVFQNAKQVECLKQLELVANTYSLPRLASICQQLILFTPDVQQANLLFRPLGYQVPSTISEDFKAIQKACKQVALQIEGDKTLYAHKCVLALRWPYFTTLFSGEWSQEAIIMDNISSDTLQSLLEYVYVGHTEITLENAVPLFVAANEFALDTVFVEPTEFLMENVQSDNVLDLLHLAHTFASEPVMTACLSYLERDPSSMKAVVKELLALKRQTKLK